MEPSEAAPVHVNRELLKAYVNAAEELRKQTGGEGGIGYRGVAAVARRDHRVGHRRCRKPTKRRKSWARFWKRYLQEALGKMDEMRRNEGRHLTEELRARVAQNRR